MTAQLYVLHEQKGRNEWMTKLFSMTWKYESSYFTSTSSKIKVGRLKARKVEQEKIPQQAQRTYI
jgi:hypothetical protein